MIALVFFQCKDLAIVSLENTTYTVLEGYEVEICFTARENLTKMAEVIISKKAVAAVG